MQRTFIPFLELGKQQAIIVDSMYPRGLILSHWRGAPTPEAVRDDTSGGIVLNALKQQVEGLDLPLVTANHFDIDGFVGVWSLLHPHLALDHESLLRQMARIGDFRELSLEEPFAHEALQLVCWINAREKELFYPPFGAAQWQSNEIALSPRKFDYFLPAFTEMLLRPSLQEEVWEPEYRQVLEQYDLIHSTQTQLSPYPELGLVLVRTPEPVHYYALFSPSRGYDIVLSLYEGHRYELEYKYTTWVDIHSRPTLPRVPLAPLQGELNQMEQSGLTWTCDSITDTGPLLRLEGKNLSKADRYAHPPERPIYPSTVSPDAMQQAVLRFFSEAYQSVSPKKYWTWKEIKALAS
jgi:hypothetical protein